MAARQTILVVASHMDDAWYGVGGLALDAVGKGHRVVFLNTVGDLSHWPVTQGREAELLTQVRAFAEDRGIEIRFLGYGYERVPDDLACMISIAEVCDDVQADILFYHWPEDTNRDHATSGRAAPYACMHAPALLGRKAHAVSQAYAFQMDSQCRSFHGSVYYDITATLPETLRVLVEIDRIYAQPWGGDAVTAIVDCLVTGQLLELTGHAAQKYALAITRGAECWVRYAECYYPLRTPIASQVLAL
jgi:LmbE family N-acetylglucosaminyl deacetylase